MSPEKRQLVDINEFSKSLFKNQSTVMEIGSNPIAFSLLNRLADFPTVDAVVLPCKIGDTVWAIRCYRGVLVPQQGRVSEMLFTDDMKLSIVVKHICRGEWGKKVFATKEDADSAIGERRDGE